jgi:hypothetical protein
MHGEITSLCNITVYSLEKIENFEVILYESESTEKRIYLVSVGKEKLP